MNQFAKELKQNMTPVFVGKFNLSLNPFSSQFDESLYYEDEGRKIISKKIAHLLDFTKLILFIQGANGLGKTTLIRQRIHQAKKNWRTCYINSIDTTSPDALIAKFTSDMQLNFTHGSNARSLLEQLLYIRESGLNPILIIDNIEHLNVSLIPLLTPLINHTKDTQPILRLLIIGEDIPQILFRIIPKDKQKSNLKYIPLPPLSEKECTRYIKHRLHSSGYEYLEPFNKNQINKIYLDAKGFPSFINQLSTHLFIQYTLDYDNKKPVLNFHEKTNNLLKITAGGLSALVLIFVTFSFFSSKNENSPKNNLASNTQKLEIPTIFDNKPEKLAAMPVAKQSNPEEIKPKTNKAKATTKEKGPITKAPLERVNVTANKTRKKTNLIQKDIEWIESKNPKHYTLQLISGSNRSATALFIKKHKINKSAVIVRSKRKGKDWYSVIYKSFNNAKLANRAIAKLPQSLRKLKPWPRPFSAIQKSML